MLPSHPNICIFLFFVVVFLTRGVGSGICIDEDTLGFSMS